MPWEAAESSATSFDYRRRARRIRANFARQPLLRHYALSNLAKEADARQPSPIRSRVEHTSVRRLPPVRVAATTVSTTAKTDRYLPVDPGTTTSAVEHGFADHVADRLHNGGFTYSDRMHLIDAAERIGIPRFRANLILALEQNRLKVCPSAVDIARTAGFGLGYLLIVIVIEMAGVALFVWAS